MVADSDAWGQLTGIFDGAGGAFLPHARAAFPAFARARAMAVKTVNGAAKPSAVADPSDSTLTARSQHSIEPNCDKPRCRCSR